MTDTYVQVNPDGSGKKIRTEENSVGGNTVEQQVVTLAKSDGTLLDTQLANLDLALSTLRDNITKTGAVTSSLADVVTALQATLKVSISGTVDVSNSPTRQLGVVTDDTVEGQMLRELRAIRTLLVYLLADQNITVHVPSLLSEEAA